MIEFSKKMLFTFAKTSEKYVTYISIKIGSISERFITKMISTKNSTNPERFKGFGVGRRIDLEISHGYTQYHSFAEVILLVTYSRKKIWILVDLIYFQ